MCVLVCIIGEIFITTSNVLAIYSLSFETSFNYNSMIHQFYLAQLVSFYKCGKRSCADIAKSYL